MRVYAVPGNVHTLRFKVEGLGESLAACPVLTSPINFTIKAGSQGESRRFTERSVHCIYVYSTKF